MNNLTGGRGELRMVVDVTRADGTTETRELVGVVDPEDLRAIGIDPDKLAATPIFPGAKKSGVPQNAAPDLSRPVFPSKPSKEQP